MAERKISKGPGLNRTYYMCKTAYFEDIDYIGASVFPSVEMLKREVGCTKECGYVEVSIRVVEKKKPVKS